MHKFLLPLLMLMSQVLLLAEERRERIFSNLYDTGAWGINAEGLGCSGPDSTLENSRSYIAFLQEFMRKHKITSVVDAGCGDWSFSHSINWGKASYLGIDIVQSVIARNQALFSSPRVAFVHGDIQEMELPQADLLICKDVLTYLTNQEVQQFLTKIGKFKYCLLVNDICGANCNKTIVCGDHRPLDLTKVPFYLKGTRLFRYFAGTKEKEVFLAGRPKGHLQSPKSFVVRDIHPFQGFFSVFMTVINYLDLYDRHDIEGLKIDFANQGLFYEAAYGPNFWNYYFEPLVLGNCEAADQGYSSADETGRIAYLAEIGLSRERIAELIQKYIHVKLEILQAVDQFVAEQFADKFVIGVHYRGTDKAGAEAERISFEKLSSAIDQFVKIHQIDDYLIFVATDVKPFLGYMQNTFPGKVLFQHCLRSADNRPIHYFNRYNKSPYNTGREALIDCLVLSRCAHLIRTSSCLSLVSTYFNPDLTNVVLNQRIRHCYNRF